MLVPEVKMLVDMIIDARQAPECRKQRLARRVVV